MTVRDDATAAQPAETLGASAPGHPFLGIGAPTAAQIAVAAQLACLLEASAPKPGNVSPGRHFADASYEDFLASAAAIGDPLAQTGECSLGMTVLRAVQATAGWTRSNTNLGIILLLVPLARAARLVSPGGGSKASARGVDLRTALRGVLEDTSVADARDVYAAIRHAAPGGLGRAETQDVCDEPTMTLLDVMRLAASRDDIAREYATGFEVTFDTAAPSLDRARRDGLSWPDAVLETFLAVLSARPDTHVIRSRGEAVAAEVSRLARVAVAAGGVRSAAGRHAIDQMDLALRDARRGVNPGTAADLTAAALFVVLLGGSWWIGQGGCDAAAR